MVGWKRQEGWEDGGVLVELMLDACDAVVGVLCVCALRVCSACVLCVCVLCAVCLRVLLWCLVRARR